MPYERFQTSAAPIEIPQSWGRAIARGILGEERASPVHPWYLLEVGARGDLRDVWPQGTETNLTIPFAKRIDSDEYACFVTTNQVAHEVVEAFLWTENGYTVTRRHPDLWSWFEEVLRDIREWDEVEA